MNIVFNALNSGLGNGGGSRTLIKSCEVLNNLGHECYIAAHIDNFTWFDHKPTIQHISKNVDVVIATACTDVVSTLKINVPKKAWWIRGHEIWTKKEEELSLLYNVGLFNIVNSKGLQIKLKSLGADSVVVPQGIDLDIWKYIGGRPYDKIRIGCLYQKKVTKRWVNFGELTKILGHKKYEYVGFGDTLREDSFLDKFVCLPTHEELVNLYSSCHIWLAPSELEGLSNVPMEAALCGCLVVCSDAPLGGMIYDYAFSDTAMIYKARDMEHAAQQIQHAKWENTANMYEYLTHFINSRERNMEKLVGYLEDI